MSKQEFADDVKAMERSLYRVARSYLHTDADAADAVQEALLRAWSKRDTLRQEAFFRTWLTRILINVCKDMLKRQGRVEVVAQVPEPKAAPVQTDAVREAMEALPPKFRVVLVLFYLDGYSLKELAQTLSLPQGTVKNRLFRARERLRNELQEEVFNDEA